MTREEAIRYVEENLLDEKYRIEALETLIPELKKSKDGRIRNCIAMCLTDVSEQRFKDYKTNLRDCLAWLKKQGKQSFNILWYDVNEEPEEQREIFCEWNSGDAIRHDTVFYHADTKTFWDDELQIDNVVRWTYVDEMLKGQSQQKEYTFKPLPRLLDMIEPTSRAKEYCQKLIDTLEKEGYSTDAKIVGEHLKIMNGEEVSMATMDEVQVDNANEVRPKFHEGDFIKHNKANLIYKVISVNNGSYYIENTVTGGGIELFAVEQTFHLWTIKDAKDGDILVDKDKPFIFKGLLDPHHPGCPVAYCGLDDDDDFIIGSGLGGRTNWWCSCTNVQPATEKQRDLLFSKMKGAGYKWYVKKKELKTIKENNI